MWPGYLRWIIVFLISFQSLKAQSQETFPEYSFSFKVKGLKDTVAYLGFHMGEQKYVRDTARVNSKGEVTFTHLTRKGAPDILKGGIYLLVLPNMQWFEFVVAEPKFTIETDTLNFVQNAQIKGSLENQLWFDYLRFVSSMQEEVQKLRAEQEALEPESPRYKAISKELEAKTKGLKEYRAKVRSEHPNTFMTTLFNAMEDVELPKDLDTADRKAAYWYMRNHFFDPFDLQDMRLLRTPIFEPKLVTYFEKVVPQQPDSVLAEARKLIKMVEGDEEMFKFVVHKLTSMFERSQVMCMDKAFVGMVETYYKTGKATWLDDSTLAKVIDRSNKLAPLLCGEKIPNIILPDTGMTVWHNLYAQNADYTVLYFWDATCGHCKKATPKLGEVYTDFLKPNGIPVFSVEGEVETTKWKDFIKEHNIPFISVSDHPIMRDKPENFVPSKTTLESINFRNVFDLKAYPVIYILDKDKKVIAKRLGVEQIQDFIEKHRAQEKKKQQP